MTTELLRGQGDFEDEWTGPRASVVDTAAQACLDINRRTILPILRLMLGAKRLRWNMHWPRFCCPYVQTYADARKLSGFDREEYICHYKNPLKGRSEQLKREFARRVPQVGLGGIEANLLCTVIFNTTESDSVEM